LFVAVVVCSLLARRTLANALIIIKTKTFRARQIQLRNNNKVEPASNTMDIPGKATSTTISSNQSSGNDLPPQMQVWFTLQRLYAHTNNNNQSLQWWTRTHTTTTNGRSESSESVISTIAREIVCSCFHDHEFAFTEKNGVSYKQLENVVLYWLEESLFLCVRDEFTNNSNNNDGDGDGGGVIVDAEFLQQLNNAVLMNGLRLIEQLKVCSHVTPSRCPTERAHAIRHLREYLHTHQTQQQGQPHTPTHTQTHTPTHTQQLIMKASQELEQLTDTQFIDIFEKKHKQFDILLQAAITAILLIRNDPYTHTSLLPYTNAQDFFASVNTPQIEDTHKKPSNRKNKDGTIIYNTPDFHLCSLAEIRDLYYNDVLIRIANGFLQHEKTTKKRMMEIAARLCERRMYVTGSGNSRGALRRATLFSIVTGNYIVVCVCVCVRFLIRLCVSCYVLDTYLSVLMYACPSLLQTPYPSHVHDPPSSLVPTPTSRPASASASRTASSAPSPSFDRSHTTRRNKIPRPT
jgi:hypothetical protein